MRILSVNIGNTQIAFNNCMWSGKEYIYLNGQVVSKEFSWFGMDHVFEVEENEGWVEYIVTTRFGWKGITADLRRNGMYLIKDGGSGTHINFPAPSITPYIASELV